MAAKKSGSSHSHQKSESDAGRHKVSSDNKGDETKGPSVKKDVQPGHRDSRTSFVFMPDNKRLGDAVKIQKRLGNFNLFPYTFVIGADTQFGLNAEIDKKPADGWEKEKTLFAGCIGKINNLRPKPKFLVLLGNMCHSTPCSNNEYAVRRNQEKDFFNVIDSLDEEIFFVPVSGERDLGERPTHATVNRYRSSFGYEYYNFMLSGVNFISLSSQYYVNNSHVSSFAEEQEKWLEEKLKEPTVTPYGAVIFMHKPPFVKDLTETDTNLSVPKTKRESLLKKLENGGVKYLFAGSLHKNAQAAYKSMEIVTTTALSAQFGSDQPGFRLVTVSQDKIEHTFVPISK